jgi:membrane-bound lytic murein transglycosylase B
VTDGLPGGGLPTGAAPTSVAGGLPGVTTPPVQQPGNGVRPADALDGWARQVGTKVGIPVVAVQAYGYAELVLARTTPSCHLSWTTIAAIAKVESSHGSANGSVLGADGSVQPPIYGLPLDGKGGRQLIRDTDQGVLDGDTTFDRAVGPLQFIPSTWNSYKVDADNSGTADPNDIDDASLTAGTYLCQGGRDMSRADSWWDAILSYNAVRPYAQKVFEAANDYGHRSR